VIGSDHQWGDAIDLVVKIVPGLAEIEQDLNCIVKEAAESSAVKSVYPNLEVRPEGQGGNAELPCEGTKNESVDHIHVER